MPKPENEAERLTALRALGLVGSQPEDHFDALCRTARSLFSTPIALVSLIEETEQWFKAQYGLPANAMPREQAFCAHALLSDAVMVVADAGLDPRFRSLPLVSGPSAIRFYAGAPVMLGPGLRVGTVAIMDTAPRTFSSAQVAQLADLAAVAAAHLRLHETRLASEAVSRQHRTSQVLLESRHRGLQERERQLQKAEGVLALAEQLAQIGHWRMDTATEIVDASAGFERVFGRTPVPRQISVADHIAALHPADRARAMDKIVLSSSGAIETYENRTRFTRPDGDPRIVIARGAVERDGEGRITAVVGVCMDVTESARAEDQLRDKSAMLATTLDSMDEGLVVVTAEGHLALINQRARALLDLPVEWLTRMPLVDEVRAFEERRGERDIARALLKHEATGERRVHIGARANGTILEFRSVRRPDGSTILTCNDATARITAEQALKESETHYRVLTETMADVIFRRDGAGRLRSVSPSVFDLLGYSQEEILAGVFLDLTHPVDREAVRRVKDGLQTGELDHGCLTYRMRHRDGRWIWVEGRARLRRDEQGRPVEVVSTLRDVSDRVTTDARLRSSEERLALALDSGGDGLWDWNIITGAVWVSGKAWAIMGLSEEGSVAFEAVMARVHPEDTVLLNGHLKAHFEQKAPSFEAEFRLPGADGTQAWLLSRGKVVERHPDGAPLRMVGTMIDVTARKEAEARIAHLSRHDGLTDLPNRVQFRDQLGQRLAEIKRHGGPLALLCLDLDCFKAVNDTLGHPAGDRVLREVAQRLRQTARLEDTVARLGSDEFAILAPCSTTAQLQRIDTVAERLIEVINQPFCIDGQEISLGLTIGIAVAPGDGEDADDLFQRAHLALYRAKSEGRNTFRFFEAAMDEALAERRRIELDLRNAIARQEFELHYQPVLDTRRGVFSGFEALVRWRRPERGLVAPADFIPIAEETGLIVPIGEWVLRTACHQAMSWADGSFTVSVNVSALQVRHGGFMDSVVAALASSGLPAERLELEITESALIGSGDAVLRLVQEIRSMGIRVALDDFGTGYSSLSYLHRFPFDRVKIDRSFVREISSPRTAAIVRATIDLATRLGMAVTAEGIETPEQLSLVTAEGCTEIQGYLISRPVTADVAATLARRHTARAA